MRKLPSFRLIPQPLDAQAEQVLHPEPFVDEQIGKRHRLGGEPEFLQAKQEPICPSCHAPMTFYAQLDAIGQASEYDIADAGLIYVFLCFDCFEATAFVQSG